jgi:hypothetical protein
LILVLTWDARPAPARPWGKTVKGGLTQPDHLTRKALTQRIDRGGERARETARQSALFREALIATGRGDAGVKARKRAEREARKQRRRASASARAAEETTRARQPPLRRPTPALSWDW